MAAASGRRRHGTHREWILLSVLAYLILRTVTYALWPTNQCAQIYPYALALLPVVYAAFIYFEPGGVISAAATILASMGIRVALRIGSVASVEVLIASSIAMVGIGLLVGHIARINHQLRSRADALQLTMREANHRIKNSLSLAASIVDMERMQGVSSAAPDVLAVIRSRLQAIAELHEQLRWDRPGDSIELVEYLRDVCARVQGLSGMPVRIDADVPNPVPVTSTRAVATALICTELLLNIAKHDRVEGEPQSASLSVTVEESTLRVRIGSDRGTFESGDGTRHGIGHVIVDALVEQLSGTVEVAARSPPAFVLSIPYSR